MKVGFIGLGAMGLPMAKRVLGAGHELFIMFHRNRGPADELASLGARILPSAAEIAQAAEAVITIVPADAELRQIVLGTGGLMEGFSAGKVLIEMTTATPHAIQEVEGALSPSGVRVLDAPVSGGTTAAAAGTLTIMAGGDPALLQQMRPLLETMGKTIFHVGAVGQGKVVKMANQALAAIHLLAIGEVFALGIKSGADPKILYEVIKASSGYSKMMDLRLPGFLLEGSFQPGFRLDLMKKDLNLALDAAQMLGVPLLFGGLAAQVFAAASQAGRGEEDFAAAADFLSKLAGAKLSAKPEDVA